MNSARARRVRVRFVAGALAIALCVAVGTEASAPPAAQAALPATTALTYVPAGWVSSLKTATQVDGYLADLDGYGIGQVLLELPRLRRSGTLPLRLTRKTALTLWRQRADAYLAAHGRPFEITAVINGRLDLGLDLANPATRANVVAAVRSLVTTYAVAGVHLDLEPYPTTSGFINLLDELDTMFAAVSFGGRLSVAAPADFARWSAAFWAAIGARVTQLDPLYYDSGLTSAAHYQTWVQDSLAQISAAVPPTTLIVPVIASYRTNAWHNPAVENVATGATALQASLAAGSRVHGAGVWWWWGLFYDENGRYNAAADRNAWQTQIRALDYTPPGT